MGTAAEFVYQIYIKNVVSLFYYFGFFCWSHDLVLYFLAVRLTRLVLYNMHSFVFFKCNVPDL